MIFPIPFRLFDAALAALFAPGAQSQVFRTKFGPTSVEFRADHCADLTSVLEVWDELRLGIAQFGSLAPVKLSGVSVEAVNAIASISVFCIDGDSGMQFRLVEEVRISENVSIIKPTVQFVQQVLSA